MTIVTLSIDLAKSSFALHGVDSSGKVLLKKNVSRKNLLEMLINMPPCLIGMEACSSAHYWARLFKQFGHDVKLMPPQFVKPYVESNNSASLNKHILLILEDAENNLTSSVRGLVAQLKELIDDLVIQISVSTKEIEHWHSTNVDSKRIAEIPGISPITATALVASIGDPASFNNGRQVSAWIGLIPKQFSTGGKQVLLDISKRGDNYLRRLLIHGARAV